MKYLRYILSIIFILVLIFFGMGLYTTSVDYNCEVNVDKPTQEVWAVMQDESKLPEWILGYQKSEHLSGTPGTVGAVSNVYVVDQGKEMVMKETITAIEPGKHMAMSFTMDFMNMYYEMRLEEKGNSTIIKTKSRTIGNGIVAKSLIAFMPKSMKAQEQENLNNLKNVIESNTKNYFPEPAEEQIDSIQSVK